MKRSYGLPTYLLEKICVQYKQTDWPYKGKSLDSVARLTQIQANISNQMVIFTDDITLLVFCLLNEM